MFSLGIFNFNRLFVRILLLKHQGVKMHNNSTNDIAARIIQLRKAFGLTQSQFAEKCDLSTSYIAAIETGCKGLGLNALRKICIANNISADFILFGSKSANTGTNSESNSLNLLSNSIYELDSSVQPHVVNIINELFAISTKLN